VTDRVAFEQPRSGHPADALTRDPALLSALVDVAEALIVVLDREGRIALFNGACERASGLRARDVLGERLWDQALLAPEEAQGVRALFARLLAGERPLEHENLWIGRDRKRRLIRWSNTVLTGPDGAVRWIIGTGIDVTAASRAETRLEESRRRAQAILDTTVDGIVVIDAHGHIESFNPAAERIFGRRREDVLGRNVRMLMPRADAERHDDYIRHYLETGERRIIGIGRRVRGRRGDGTEFPMELAISEVRLADRRLFTGIVRDVSDRERAEREAQRWRDELAHAARVFTVGELATGLAHEVNQPLTAMVSYAEACLRMLDGGAADAERLRETLARIVGQGERAAGIVRGIRQLVRKEAGKRAPVDVNRVIRDVTGLLSHELRAGDVAASLDLGPAVPAVHGDRIQIEQVLLNLARNALDAMAAEPRSGSSVARAAPRELHIRSRVREPAVIEVTVSDTGPGVPSHVAERLFDTFFTTKAQGLGMGLAISRSLVEAHGGRLWLEPGAAGATFRFTLPVGRRGDASSDER